MTDSFSEPSLASNSTGLALHHEAADIAKGSPLLATVTTGEYHQRLLTLTVLTFSSPPAQNQPDSVHMVGLIWCIALFELIFPSFIINFPSLVPSCVLMSLSAHTTHVEIPVSQNSYITAYPDRRRTEKIAKLQNCR